MKHLVEQSSSTEINNNKSEEIDDNDYIQLWNSFTEEELNTHTHTSLHVYMDSHLLTLSATLISAPASIKYLTMSLWSLSAALMRAVSPSLHSYYII